MTDIVPKVEEAQMEIAENQEVVADAQKENAELKDEVKPEEKEEEEEHVDEILEEEMDETEEVEEKPEVKTESAAEPVNVYGISNIYKSAAAVDIGKFMIMAGLPSSFYDDAVDIFNEYIVSMLESDFSVKKDSIESITRLTKGGEDEENGCRVLVSFKIRVHKHRVLTVKNRADVGYTLEQVEAVPADVVELLKEVEKTTNDKKESIKKKKEEEKKEKDEERFKDEHSVLPFKIEWDGAPEFQWKIPEGGKGGVNLVIENAEVQDIYEPFMYRASLKAQSVSIKVPGRIIDDQPTAKHYGTITLQYLNDGEAIRFAMVNLIYFRSRGDRRIKVFLPQTVQALKRKSEFEKRLGRKIEIPEQMRKMLVKSTDLSLSESTFGVEEAKAIFQKEIESVESVVDSNEKTCFVVVFKCPHDAVMAHTLNRTIKIGDVQCRIYMLGSECNGDDREGRKYLTRLETIAQAKELQKAKKLEYDEKVAKGEIIPKKPFIKKTPLPLIPRKKNVPLSSSRNIPINKSNGPSFKTPLSSSRVTPRSAGYSSSSSKPYSSTRAPLSSSPSRGGRVMTARPMRRDEPMQNRSAPRTSPWSNDRRSGGSVGQLSMSAFNKDDLRMEEMVREQRRQMEMQERLLRQQEMLSVMADRLNQPALSTSAFRQRDYELSSSASSSYGVPPAVAYNKASSYTPSPAYEPLTATMTPSHLSNPATDMYRSSSSFGSAQYGKPSTSAYPSSSYQDRRY